VEVKKAVEELKQLKKNIKETVHSYLIQDILMNCKAITLPCGATPPTRRIDDICEVWAQNPSLVQHLWTVLVKRYEDMGEWELKFEAEVMNSLNLQYIEDDDVDEKLVAQSRDSAGNVTKVTYRKKAIFGGIKGVWQKW
jgi:hypothetical protein